MCHFYLFSELHYSLLHIPYYRDNILSMIIVQNPQDNPQLNVLEAQINDRKGSHLAPGP